MVVTAAQRRASIMGSPKPKPLEDSYPDDLDEAMNCTFSLGQAVWVRVEHTWMPGKVVNLTTRVGPTRQGNGLFYAVVYNRKFRKYFAPLNGDVKPDNSRVRRLLWCSGWLEDCSDME